jgi:hypothetical protein
MQIRVTPDPLLNSRERFEWFKPLPKRPNYVARMGAPLQRGHAQGRSMIQAHGGWLALPRKMEMEKSSLFEL